MRILVSIGLIAMVAGVALSWRRAVSDEQTDRGNAGGAGGGDCLDSLCRDAADRQHRCPHAPYDRAQTIDAEQSMPDDG